MLSIFQTKKWLAFVVVILAVSQFSCKKTDGYNEIVSTDLTKPGVVTNIKVTNFNGGAYITYSLPESKNILYVQAEYLINNKVSRQTKSSYYSDSVTVSGFAKSQDYKVLLYTVSRANIKSDSVVVTVHPATPPYLETFASLSMQNDFGGVNIRGRNDLKADIGVVAIMPDVVTKKLEIINQNYTNQDSINYSLRGFDTLPKQFGLYVTDQFGNRSDTLFATINPIYETIMNKGLFTPYILPTDVLSYNDYYGLHNLWDNVTTGTICYNTEQPIQVHNAKNYIWPAWVTFDMGRTARLSRYIIWGRDGDQGQFLWSEGTPQTWVIWGRADAPQDELMPSDSTELPPVGGMTPNGWINMGLYNALPKPSGLPSPQFTNDDWNFWKQGFGYNFSIDLPKVRYIRFECLENMGHTDNFFDIDEMSFYGDPR